MNILIVAAHPDDEVLGCGGAIVKHVMAGDKVHLLVFTDGVTSREYTPGISEARLMKLCSKKIKIRKNEFYKAAKILGVKKRDISFYDLPDNRMDSIPLLDIIKRIEIISLKIKFDIIYTHHWGDVNIDHRKCLEAVLTAFRPSRRPGNTIAIYCFEIPGNMDVLPPFAENKFDPDHYVDISDSIDTKRNAINAYLNELKNLPPDLKIEKIMEHSRKRGKEYGVKYAEAYVEATSEVMK